MPNHDRARYRADRAHRRIGRATVTLAALLAWSASAAAQASAASSFDLAGPQLAVTVTRQSTTLPVAQVPDIAPGDRITVRLLSSPQSAARFHVLLAFLRGATDPPPADWLIDARPWDPKRATIDATVPVGASQAIILLVPDTGGALKAVASTLRGRPGAFVRAAGELFQASLDRARLDTYLAASRQQAGDLAATAALAKSLAVKIDPACLVRQPETQAACLAQVGGAAVLADAQTTSLAQNIAGAPADLALAVSSTPQASFGYYSSYIGLVRDIARIFGAFQSAQLQFLPTLAIQRGEEVSLFLGTPPSFRRPQSVLLAPLPAIAPAHPPAIEPVGTNALCTTRTPLLAAFTGTPLLYATAYAGAMRLRVTLPGGDALELPATADPVAGGYVIDAGADRAKLTQGSAGTLHGRWGFTAFDGPHYALVAPVDGGWHVAGRASLVVGRDSPLPLTGGATTCLSGVAVERDGELRPVGWSADSERGATLRVPLEGTEPGSATILLSSWGDPTPQRLVVRTFSEPSRLVSFTIHPGDRTGELTGSRLDQVAAVDLDGITWRPDTLSRVRSTDRLDMIATANFVAAVGGDTRTAQVTLADGRTANVRVTIAPARAAASLLGRSLERIGAVPRVPIRIDDPDLLPADMRIVFSIRAPEGMRLAAGDQIDVAAGAQTSPVRLPLRLQDASVGIADIVPAQSFGQAAFGPARYRLVKDGMPGDWRSLGTIARLPTIRDIRCANSRCWLEGDALYLLAAVTPAAAPAPIVKVPDGYTADSLDLPLSPSRQWRLVLRDSPSSKVFVAAP